MVYASACALIWAAGNYKAMAPNSLIGFHAAWENNDGETVVSSVGNALVGAYLQSIGFTETGIVFATIAGPDEINWMTIVDAQDAGLDVRLMDRNGKMIARSIPNKGDFKKLTLELPTGYRWIVLESATSVSSLNKNAASALPVDLLKTVETKSGYFALIAGTFRCEIAENILKEVKEIPRDAYLMLRKRIYTRNPLALCFTNTIHVSAQTQILTMRRVSDEHKISNEPRHVPVMVDLAPQRNSLPQFNSVQGQGFTSDAPV